MFISAWRSRRITGNCYVKEAVVLEIKKLGDYFSVGLDKDLFKEHSMLSVLLLSFVWTQYDFYLLLMKILFLYAFM